jgi:hypothetical protein
LHALGDASQVQHVDATTGYGHVPLESFTDGNLDNILRDPMVEMLDANAVTQYERILANSFRWWKLMNKEGASIQSVIEGLAFETRQHCNSWDAYKDWASILEKTGSPDMAKAQYNGSEDNLRPDLENGAAATLAYLVTISSLIPDNLPKLDTNCPVGKFYWTGSHVVGTGCPEQDELYDFFQGVPAGCYPCIIEPEEPIEPNEEICAGTLCDESDPGGLGDSCKSSADCQSNLICMDGTTCQYDPAGECWKDSDCTEGRICAEGKCLVPLDGDCEFDAECAGGFECRDGFCRLPIIK